MKKDVLNEITVKSETVFSGPVFRVEKSEVILPDGKSARRDVLRHLGAVCVIPIDEDNNVIAVRQYRTGFGGITLEIPAGKLDSKDEEPFSAAKRELQEEVGAVAKEWTYLGEYYGSPAIVDEKIHMYMAKELEYSDVSPDEDEFIEIERIPLEVFKDMVIRGEIPDGKTQCAVLRAYLMRN